MSLKIFKKFLKEMLPSFVGGLVGLLVLQVVFGPPLGSWFENKPERILEGNYQMYFAAVDQDTVAIMYGTKWCPYCRKTKEYFSANKIAYIERDVESSDEDMTAFRNLGGEAYPLILLRNRKIIGFQKNALDQLLGIRL